MDTNTHNTQSLATADIVLAAFLKVTGFSLDRIDKQGNRGIFIFNAVDSAVLQKYDLGQALVEPISLNNAIKSLTTATRRIS